MAAADTELPGLIIAPNDLSSVSVFCRLGKVSDSVICAKTEGVYVVHFFYSNTQQHKVTF